jgi:predicted protein tyrosine phosphatase
MPKSRKEKAWKQVSMRHEKLHRAAQLGLEYPIIRNQERIDESTTNVLFVCSRNRWRSPTAERIYRRRAGLRVRSAGTSRTAVHPLSAADVAWADVIILMEDKHRSRMTAAFPDAVRHKDIHVLGIPDDYGFMDPDLIDELTAAIDPILFPAS